MIDEEGYTLTLGGESIAGMKSWGVTDDTADAFEEKWKDYEVWIEAYNQLCNLVDIEP